MPGIPTHCTPEAIAFWASFWPDLYSDLISSVVTSLLIGSFIVWLERHIEARDTRKSYEREVSVMRQRLREAVSCPDTFTLSHR